MTSVNTARTVSMEMLYMTRTARRATVTAGEQCQEVSVTARLGSATVCRVLSGTSVTSVNLATGTLATVRRINQ